MSSPRRNSLTVVLIVAMAIMAGEIFFLAKQNRRLQSMLADSPAFQVLQPGQALPPLSTTDLDGANVAIGYGENAPSTILVWFSPSCHLCSQNAPFWNDIYHRYHTSPGVRFLVMSDANADETQAYVTENAMALPVVCVTDESSIDAYNGRVLPQTALISPRGGIQRVWPGVLEPTRQEEITAVLDSLTR